MQKKIKFTGIVLKNRDYQDNAQIIYVLTKDNLDSILVRGAKKIDSKTRPLAQIITKIEGLRTEKEKMRKQRKRATSRLVLFLDGSWVGKMAELSFPSIFSAWA